MKKTLVIVCTLLLLFSCRRNVEDEIAVIWTNQIEFVTYAKEFNNAQHEYKVIIEYKANPADSLMYTDAIPDIVVGPWLKGDATRAKFLSINNLLSEKAIDPHLFYASLLTLGNVGNTQYLLPVSFNLPAIMFSSSEKHSVKNHFTLSLEEMRSLAQAYNQKKGTEYVRMGFSPRWDMDFLYVCTQGFDAAFEETNHFFSWDDQALQKIMQYMRDWSINVNTSAAAEDEFKFKYLYDPPYALVTSGRCLFWYIPSDKLFALSNDQLKAIDYRWMSYNNKTPLQDTIIYAGICKKARNKKAAKAFLTWFFNAETQKILLERSHANNMIEPSFGLAGGFSSIRNVTENIFPLYYPLLLKRLPQMNAFSAPHILPNNWETLKKEILFPFFIDQTQDPANRERFSLNKHIADWYKTASVDRK